MPSGSADELRKAGYSVEPVQTNMVYVQIGEQAQALKAFAEAHGITFECRPALAHGHAPGRQPGTDGASAGDIGRVFPEMTVQAV